MFIIPRQQPKRKPKRNSKPKLTKEERIAKLHNKANDLMKESQILDRDIIKLEKEIAKTRPNTKKITILKTRRSKKRDRYYSKQHEIKNVLYKKDKLLGYTTKKGYKKPFE